MEENNLNGSSKAFCRENFLTGFTFVEIKKQKTKIVLALFIFLILFYFFTAILLEAVLKIIFIADYAFEHPFVKNKWSFWPSRPEIFVVFFVAFFAALIHWYFSIRFLVDKILNVLNSKPLDKNDGFHKQFRNIVDEVSVATGGRYIETYVIPSSSKNAFSIADFSGRSAIGVTEGLLAKLSRPQLEGVVAHEAAHIVSGDSLTATVSSSVFGLYAEMIKAIQNAFDKRFSIYLLASYVVLIFAQSMNFLISMFISRQREYRADAVGVELSRDPLSLAEALYIISNSWRGGGSGGDNLESIFIMNPNFNTLDEAEGIFAELFSTHPPTSKRIALLLAFGHANIEGLSKSIKSKKDTARRHFEEETLPAKSKLWLVNNPEGKWVGPFNLDELKGFFWFSPQSWVEKIGDRSIKPAYEDADLNNIFRKGAVERADALKCPVCKQDLGEILYEETPINQCKFCKGVLVEKDKISKILTRREEGFTPEVLRMAEIIKLSQGSGDFSRINTKMKPSFPCPKCKKLMERRFYSLAYPVEIDKCEYCGTFWFDRYELEVFQKLYEDNEAQEERFKL